MAGTKIQFPARSVTILAAADAGRTMAGGCPRRLPVPFLAPMFGD